MGWLKVMPKDSCRREVGHAAPTMGRSKLHPNDNPLSDRVHHSMAMPCSRSPDDESRQVSCRGRKAGTRLGTRRARELSASGAAPCDSEGGHKLRGVPPSTRTSKDGTLRHILQNSSDTRCSSRVDMCSLTPSHAWLKTTMKTSRHRSLPIRMAEVDAETKSANQGGGERQQWRNRIASVEPCS